MNEPKLQDSKTIGGGLRILVIATIFATAAATLTASGGFLLTVPLILGLIAEWSAPRRGRWLMWAGAAYLTVTLLQMEVRVLPEFLAEWHSGRILGTLGRVVFPFSVASVLLILWCDVALVLDALRNRHNSETVERNSAGAGDWIVWISALLFSVYSFSGIPFLIHSYGHGFHSIDVSMTAGALIVIAVSLDLALLEDAILWLRIG